MRRAGAAFLVMAWATACFDPTGAVTTDARPATDAKGVDADLSACGNGELDGTEACDDGNVTNGDGCDNNCTVTGCGNGVVTAGEACDLGAANGNLICVDGADMGNTCATGLDCAPVPTVIGVTDVRTLTVGGVETLNLNFTMQGGASRAVVVAVSTRVSGVESALPVTMALAGTSFVYGGVSAGGRGVTMTYLLEDDLPLPGAAAQLTVTMFEPVSTLLTVIQLENVSDVNGAGVGGGGFDAGTDTKMLTVTTSAPGQMLVDVIGAVTDADVGMLTPGAAQVERSDLDGVQIGSATSTRLVDVPGMVTNTWASSVDLTAMPHGFLILDPVVTSATCGGCDTTCRAID